MRMKGNQTRKEELKGWRWVQKAEKEKKSEQEKQKKEKE